MSKRFVNLIAALLLVFVFVIAVTSMAGDSLTMDELAHLPAGYSYVTQKDMRLNPEHPPLVKDMAGIPLLFIDGINFPYEIKDWTEFTNGQWGFGSNFLFHRGNPVDTMVFWGRIPAILLLVLTGFYIFKASKEFFGDKAGLLALAMFSFSPTFLAHGRLVTTDVGAAFGAFIGIYYFVKALKSPSAKNIIFSGIAFGVAELLKFSLILLGPLFFAVCFVWFISKTSEWKNILKTLILTFAIGFLLVEIVYIFHVWNYPPDLQARDMQLLLRTTPYPIVREILLALSQIPLLRAFAQYVFGLAMIFERAAGGNTTYFWGEVSAAGWKHYFPTVYLLKEPLTYHILSFISLIYAIFLAKVFICRDFFKKIREWAGNHIIEISFLGFICLYWITSLTSNLNIGVRHLLPIFPCVIFLTSGMIIKLLKPPYLKIKYAFLGGLVLWQAVSVLMVYPHMLAYFNELAGGPNNGYKYTVDSNLDWGQDMKRLKNWVEKNNIDKIYVDYFGGSDASYYLGDKFMPWWGTRNPEEFQKGNYLAVSATLLQGGRGTPVKGFDQSHNYYDWLNGYEPVTKIGYSIFVYYIE